MFSARTREGCSISSKSKLSAHVKLFMAYMKINAELGKQNADASYKELRTLYELKSVVSSSSLRKFDIYCLSLYLIFLDLRVFFLAPFFVPFPALRASARASFFLCGFFGLPSEKSCAGGVGISA